MTTTYVDVTAQGLFEAILILSEEIPNAYYNLILYDDQAQVIASDYTYSEPVHIVQRDLFPGRYYLLVNSRSQSSQTQPYQLQVFLPG